MQVQVQYTGSVSVWAGIVSVLIFLKTTVSESRRGKMKTPDWIIIFWLIAKLVVDTGTVCYLIMRLK